MRSIILASQSPRRKILLKQIGFKFRVIPSKIPEVINKKQTYTQNAKRIALEKAISVANRFKKGLVIGADTFVVLNHHILGKPSSKEDARRMLRLLSGREHSVYSGFAIYDSKTKKHVEGCEKTKVIFRNLNETEIEQYIASGAPMDKAGSYGIQDDYGAVFIEKINGCFYNVVGFPLSSFYIAFHKFIKELEK